MHDPRLIPGHATNYHVDATPGRHTQGGSWLSEAGFAQPGPGKYFAPIEDKYSYSGKGETAKILSCFMHVVNAAGMCMFGALIDEPDAPLRCQVKIRYRSRAVAATVEPAAGGRFHVRFDEPRHGVAPGQAAVCYDGDRVLGGGWIE